MDDGRWYLASIISCSWRRKLQEAGVVDRKMLVVCSTMAATAGEINLISKWFAMIVCSAWVENMIEYHSCLGMA